MSWRSTVNNVAMMTDNYYSKGVKMSPKIIAIKGEKGRKTVDNKRKRNEAKTKFAIVEGI